MADLIQFSTESGLGPLGQYPLDSEPWMQPAHSRPPTAALTKYAQRIREQQPHGMPNKMSNGYPGEANYGNTNGITTTPAVTLYTNAASAPNQTSAPPSLNSGSLQNHAQSQNSVSTLGDTASPRISTASSSAQTPTAPPLSAGPSNSSHTTPLVNHATLKRKVESPSTAQGDQPPAKRMTRKRGRTAGG